MPNPPYSDGVQSVEPDSTAPNVRQSIQTSPEMFGGGVARGTKELAAGGAEAASNVFNIADFYDNVATDDQINKVMQQSVIIRKGDPNKMVAGPDGQQVPDTGYMGLQGKDAMNARAGTEKALDDVIEQGRQGLSPKAVRAYNTQTRRLRSYWYDEIGTHADTQTKTWSVGVYGAQADLGLAHIAANPNDPTQVAAGAADYIQAKVKAAQIKFGNDPTITAGVVAGAKRDALQAQLDAISVTDPSRAMSILEKNRAIAGVHYDDLANKYRARSQKQDGDEYADGLLATPGAAPPNGGDAKAVLRGFEGLKDTAYWDHNHWRVGYGSDTVTRADGTVESVTQGTKVSREDAERDLERRTRESQTQAVSKVGADNWQKLSPEAKASLTSITYNYGNLPDSVAEAAKTGDPAVISKAVLGLSGHNGGINAGRRAAEAGNIIAGAGGQQPQAGRPSIQDETKLHVEVDQSGMSDTAKASAHARITHSYSIYHNAQVKQQSAFTQRVDDGRAEALNTGSVGTPIAKEEFTQQYGDVEGPVKYQAYQADVQYGVDYKTMQGLSDAQQQALVNSRGPTPGQPGYAHSLATQDRLRKGMAQIQTQRRDDPAGSVDRMPAVIEAQASYDQAKPETFAPVAAARLAAQDRLGIDPEYQSPISKTEALKLTTPLRTMLPGQERDTLTQIATTFQKMFGDNADKAFAYAIRAHKVDAETAQTAARVMRKLGLGQAVVPSDAGELDTSHADAAENKAMNGTAQVSRDYGFDAGAASSGVAPKSNEPAKDETPNVPPRAIEFLLRNPGTVGDFDKQFGKAGLGKSILEKYGPPPGLP